MTKKSLTLDPETACKQQQHQHQDITCHQKRVTPSIVISGASFDENHDDVRLTTQRFLILSLFCLYSMSNSFQWIQYAIITNVISDYYNVSNLCVNWTSVIYMAIYIPGIIPASWLLNRKGLRFCVLLGSCGTCAGAWIKCLSVAPDKFTVTMIGQSVVAMSQLFVLNLPPRIATVWFGPKEVSSATSFGVFGNQLGIALGFIIPPIIFASGGSGSSNNLSTEFVENGLTLMFFSQAIITTVIFIAIIFFFRDRPSKPPSLAAALADQQMILDGSFSQIMKSLFGNRNFVLLLTTYGLNVGVFYAISTILNQLIELQFPGHEVDAGIMGLILTLSGVFGSVICGLILDQTHKFKGTTLIVYIFSLFGMIAFSLALQLNTIIPLFLVSAVLGFFMTGYLPIGFEFAAELSYPNPEGSSAGLLNAAAQVRTGL
jgi:FLVCR family feline leukemia virus subgroup C receptor-related protein